MAIKQFVTFGINHFLLGIDILVVREINKVLDITPVQRAPNYVYGLVNLRGQIITVFDLGVRLGLGPRKITPQSHNVFLKNELISLLVDSIGDVVQVNEADVELAPAHLGGVEKRYISGVVKLKQELLIILSGPKILEYYKKDRGKNGDCIG
ncbi:MAG: chemotaxis protein CheW [Thermodesulfobacteriota bacterium]|nr:chemotaxis protein CheW [Thermodesulfobacteriota bacterium]